jgi:hypothetical protein
MGRTTFLDNYRIRLGYDGSPYEPDRNGPVVSYEAVDQRTTEPVFVMLIPAESIDPSEREHFEENVSAALKLRHVNIAKVLDFGHDGDDYVYVSERLGGETLASWVRNHGPMAADAALRAGEQIVSVLSSAGFHNLPYPSIQPGDIMLVPGQTAEGSWPLVKVTKFGLPALVPCPESRPTELEIQREPTAVDQIANNQQFCQPTSDVRSEIYSLGVTLYFLLSGVPLSAEALQHLPNFSGFPKPLRLLLKPMLHRNPNQRPKDLLVVTELIRQSLEKIERRRALSDRYGIPLKTTVAPRTNAPSHRLVRIAVAFGLLLAFAAAIAQMVFPDSIGKMLRLTSNSKPVGVLIGVPESSPLDHSTTAPGVVASQPVNPTITPETQAPTSAETLRNPPGIQPAHVQHAQTANARSAASTPSDSVQNSTRARLDSSPSTDTAANSSAQANTELPSTTASQSSSHGNEKSVGSRSRRPGASQSSRYSSRGQRASMRSRVVGITPDGRLILRLRSGRIAIVAPDEDFVPHHRNRVFPSRGDMFAPPPRFGPDYFQDD